MSRRIRQRQPDFQPLSSSRPLASIVLVTYHTEARFIENCLVALRQLDYAAAAGGAEQNFEVLVVDNGSHVANAPGARAPNGGSSSEGTRDSLRRCVRGETLILNECNRGFAGGCNDGIRRAKGEIIVLLNVDTVVDADWLSELVKPLVRDRRAVMVGCKMYYPPDLEGPPNPPDPSEPGAPAATRGKIQHAGGVMHANAMVEHRGYGEEDVGQYDEEVEVDYVTGAAVAIRREFLELCGGGLDEDYFPAYYEETDLCYRARLMGYRVIYAPRATLVHHESTLLGVGSPLFNRLCYRGRILFCLKNYRLRDWLFKFIPSEIAWLCAPHSKGFRRMQLRAYLDGLKFLFGHRYTPDRPFPALRK